MLLVSNFNYWAFPTVIILITVHRPSFWLLSLWTRIKLSHVAGVSLWPTPFWRRKNPPTKIVTEISVCKFGGWKFGCGTVSTTCIVMQRISDNASHSIRSELFNRVNPDRVTICDAIRRADAFLFLNIWRIIVFSQQTENQHFFDLFKEAPYILTMNRIIVIHSLALIPFR